MSAVGEEFSSDDIGDFTTDSHTQQGKWNGGIALGYKSVEVEGSLNRKRRETQLEIVDEEAALVRLIFDKYANGQGFKSITNELNHQGYKTKTGGAFSVTTIKGTLSNSLYIGKIRFNKQQDWNTKQRKGTNPAPIITDGEHNAIITQELWDKVQARYANANNIRPGSITVAFRLLVLCAAHNVATEW